jgi:hypothetical protein
MRLPIFAVSLMVGALIALGVVAPAGAEKRHTLKGRTQQGLGIRVAVRERTVDVLRFKAELRCRDGSILLLDESGFLPTPLKRGGAFRDVQYGRTDTVYLRGRAQGRKVRGRLKVKDKLGNGVRCASKWLRFSAPR